VNTSECTKIRTKLLVVLSLGL